MGRQDLENRLMKVKDEMHSKDFTRPTSKIKVPDRKAPSDIEHDPAYRDAASKMVSDVGRDSIWHVVIFREGASGQMFGEYYYEPDYEQDFLIYAFDEEDLKDRLSVLGFKDSGSGKLTNSRNWNRDYIKSFAKVSRQQADEIIEKDKEKAKQYNTSLWKYYYDTLGQEIAVVPTSKMYDEMSKSLDWAINILKKMKDQEDARLKEEWLKTDDGKAWLSLYNEKQDIIKNIEKLDEKSRKAAETARANSEQRQIDSEEVYKCFLKKSTEHPEYNLGIVPVIVKGGRGFNGNGFVVSIYEATGSFSWHYSHGVRVDDETSWTKVQIYLPLERVNKFASASLQFCKLDTSETPYRCSEVLEQFKREKLESTIQWCKEKDPSKSEIEIRRWTLNILKKHLPNMDFTDLIGNLGDVNGDKAKSTIKWVLGLGYQQAKSSRILKTSFMKKNLNPNDYRSEIESAFTEKFGKCKFPFES